MLYKLTVLFCITALFGCATVQPPTSDTAKTVVSPVIPKEAIYHIVQKGQTLWRISRIYDIDLDEIVRINNIGGNTSLSIGQTLVIPKSAYNQSKSNFSTQTYADFIWPVKGTVVTQFKQRSSGVLCKGIDITVDPDEDILASREGRVAYIGDLAGYGKTLVIDHKDGLSSVYCGSSSILVKTGDEIEQGMIIAKAGQSPRAKDDCIHFEIRKNHRPQNPLFYLN